MDVIETERLLLEPLDGSRLEEFIVLTADPETMRYWDPRGPYGRDAAERNFAASLERLRDHGFGRRWIVVKDSAAGLGFTETKYFGESCDEVSPDEIEIGWMLKRETWGRGSLGGAEFPRPAELPRPVSSRAVNAVRGRRGKEDPTRRKRGL